MRILNLLTSWFVFSLVLLSFQVQASLFLSAEQCPRIISQSPYITHQLDYLGLKHCLVGASRYDKELQLIDTGGIFDPDKEVIAKLNADLWLTSNWTKPEVFEEVKQTTKQALRLDSFDSMTQIELNLSQIINALQTHLTTEELAQLAQRRDAFVKQWRHQAALINGNGKSVLLISSCSDTPYSFGHQTWLADLFRYAGFHIIAPSDRIQFFARTSVKDQLQNLIDELHPQLVFIFQRQLSNACQLDKLPKNTTIVPLDGDLFLQPAPILLHGINSLIGNPLWQ